MHACTSRLHVPAYQCALHALKWLFEVEIAASPFLQLSGCAFQLLLLHLEALELAANLEYPASAPPTRRRDAREGEVYIQTQCRGQGEREWVGGGRGRDRRGRGAYA